MISYEPVGDVVSLCNARSAGWSPLNYQTHDPIAVHRPQPAFELWYIVDVMGPASQPRHRPKPTWAGVLA